MSAWDGISSVCRTHGKSSEYAAKDLLVHLYFFLSFFLSFLRQVIFSQIFCWCYIPFLPSFSCPSLYVVRLNMFMLSQTVLNSIMCLFKHVHYAVVIFMLQVPRSQCILECKTSLSSASLPKQNKQLFAKCCVVGYRVWAWVSLENKQLETHCVLLWSGANHRREESSGITYVFPPVYQPDCSSNLQSFVC